MKKLEIGILKTVFVISSMCLLQTGFTQEIKKSNSKKDILPYCEMQAKFTVAENTPDNQQPIFIADNDKQWTNNNISNWRSGFWPGIEWYLYEGTKNEYWKNQAESTTAMLSGILDVPVVNHDLGFQLYCSYGNGYRLTGNPLYKQILLRAADSLTTLYNPNVGTILSWPYRVKNDHWTHHTIIDNMMNLELLFWAAKNGGNKRMYNIAVRHAEVTMKNHFRPDFSAFHVIFYNDSTGQFIKGKTHQGYADASMWARGQAWAIYGFTMTYRETGNKAFLQTAINAADKYLKDLPADHIPYWDFNDPAIPNAPRDASAAAITASALFELSGYCNDPKQQKKYRKAAKDMMQELLTDKYLSNGKNHAFLLHSTGNKPADKEIDVPLIYADYYFMEALLRMQKLNSEKK